MSENKGIMLALCTALISGVSIFINSFAVQQVDPFNLTLIRNSLVAIMLLSLLFLIKEFELLKKLTLSQWQKLALIGFVGGSIPFLLFFYALKSTSAASAGFIHKTLFIYVAILAAVFLKEKLSTKFFIGALLLLLGNVLLFSGELKTELPFLLVFIATLLWAIENVISKDAITSAKINPRLVAFGRMFFGSIFILLILLPFGALNLPNVESSGWSWIIITTALLFLYVTTYYSSLKYIPVSKAAAIIMLAQPITGVLSSIFLGKSLSLQQGVGFTLIVIGTIVIIGASFFLQTIYYKGSMVAQRRN